jgi:hypothetical protein
MDVVDKRIRSMMTRVLSATEHLLKCDFDDLKQEEEVRLSGEEILSIRNIVLDAGNDAIRALSKDGHVPGGLRFERHTFPIFKHAKLEFEDDDAEGDVPVITMRGETDVMHELRDKMGIGVVYNENGYTYYNCSGVDDIAYHVIPFLDKARMARIVVGNGQYADWRERVIRMYRGLEED